jgi:collagenase-like PrtC family protease
MDFALTVGYSGKLADLKSILDASTRVRSVYTGGVHGKVQGGRPQYINDLADLEPQIELAHSRGASFEIALNASCGLRDRTEKQWWSDVAAYLRDLERLGVDRVVASHPFIIELTKRETALEVVVSTICEITNARSAAYYEKLGGDIIIPSMNANARMEDLRRMKATLKKAPLRIMVNEHCLGDCPWRRFHHSHYAHSNREIDYHVNCKTTFLRDPYLVLTGSAIRPEDLPLYAEVSSDFKIVGRLVPIDDLVKRVRAYGEGRFDGNFVELVDSVLARRIEIPNEALDGLQAKKMSCDNVCQPCGYCPRVFARAGRVHGAVPQVVAPAEA